MTRHAPRPWYALDGLVDEYVDELRNGGDWSRMRASQLIRATVVNIGVIAITLISLFQGGDPTVVPSLAITTLALYNGVELADYIALATAVAEVAAGDIQRDDDDGGDGDT